jgi:hypothetical protein
MGSEFGKIIPNMIQDFRFVDTEELLSAKKWQHVEAEY